MFPRRRWIVFFALVALIGRTAVGGLDAVLRAMHLAGGVAGSLGSINKVLASAPTSIAVVQSWSAWGNHAAPCKEVCSAPHVTVVGWLLIDALIVGPATAIAVGLWAKRRSGFLIVGSWIEQVVSIATWGAIFYLVLYEAADLLSAWFIFYNEKGAFLANFIGYVALARELSLALVVVPILLSYPFWKQRPSGMAESDIPKPCDAPKLWPTIQALRIPAVMSLLAVAVLLGLPASVRPQLDDVARMWFDTNGWHALWAVLAVMALSVGLFAACVVIQTRGRSKIESAHHPEGPKHLRRLAIVALLLWLAYALAGPIQPALKPLTLAAAVLVTLVVLTSVPPAVRDAPRSRPATTVNMAVATGIALAPIIALGLFILSVTAFAGALHVKALEIGLSAVLFGAAGALWFAYPWLAAKRSTTSAAFAPVAAATLGSVTLVALAIAVASRWNPLGVGWGAGAIAMLFVALLAFLGVLIAVEQSLWRPPAGSLAVVRLRRAPIITALVVVAVLQSTVDTNAVFYAVHLDHKDPAPSGATTGYYQGEPGESAANAFDAYVTTRASALRAPSSRTVPIFVIASSGGGARSNYWTVVTLDCLFANSAPPQIVTTAQECQSGSGRPNWQDVFVASGISGGSVGLAMYDAKHRASPATGALDIDRIFARGFLDPTATGLITGDIPNALVHAAHARDRARVLEESWDSVVPEMKLDFLHEQRTNDFPILMLNGADVNDGCRINVSILRLSSPGPPIPGDPSKQDPAATCHANEYLETAPSSGAQSGASSYVPLVGTRDVLDYICQDRGDVLSYATAALLSARFPYVSPTGALSRCDRTPKAHIGSSGRAPSPGPRHTIYVVDGGYVDSSAASPLVELLNTLAIGTPTRSTKPATTDAPCYQPVVLQIDNGYADSVAPTSPGRPAELIAPINGILGGGHSDNAEQALAELAARTRCPLPAGLPTYLHVYPRAHPGTTAPLGWSLSETARADMNDQLAQVDNQVALCNARRWLLTHERNTLCAQHQGVSGTTLSEYRHIGLIAIIAIIVALVAASAFIGSQRKRARALLRILSGKTVSTPQAPMPLPTPRRRDHPGDIATDVSLHLDRIETNGHPRGYTIPPAPPGSVTNEVDTPGGRIRITRNQKGRVERAEHVSRPDLAPRRTSS